MSPRALEKELEIIVDIHLHHSHLVTHNLLLIPHLHIYQHRKIFLDMNRKTYQEKSLQGQGQMQVHQKQKINHKLESLSLACSVISPKLLETFATSEKNV
jgi:hypothetical protein